MFKLILIIICFMFMPVRLMAISPNNSDVRFTVHNLSYNVSNDSIGISDSYRQISANNTDATEVCVFCHTPHTASTSSIQLWNKVSGVAPYDQPAASAYQLYTSSPRLTNTVKHSALTATSESMLCLSCHDGRTAINVLHNTSVSAPLDANGNSVLDMGIVGSSPLNMDTISAGTIYTDDIGAARDPYGNLLTGKPNSGKNLTDDHPIGFSYAAAQAEKPGKLRPLSDAKTYGMRFYGPGQDRVECSTCHNPHVYYGQGKTANLRWPLPQGATQPQLDRTPFLVRDNNGSAICLSCHIK